MARPIIFFVYDEELHADEALLKALQACALESHDVALLELGEENLQRIVTGLAANIEGSDARGRNAKDGAVLAAGLNCHSDQRAARNVIKMALADSCRAVEVAEDGRRDLAVEDRLVVVDKAPVEPFLSIVETAREHLVVLAIVEGAPV